MLRIGTLENVSLMSVVHPELHSTVLYIDAMGMGMDLGGAYKQVKRHALYTTELYLDSKSGVLRILTGGDEYLPIFSSNIHCNHDHIVISQITVFLFCCSWFSNSSARVVYIYQYSSPVMLLYLVEVSLKDDVVYIYTPHIFKICFTGPPKNKRIII